MTLTFAFSAAAVWLARLAGTAKTIPCITLHDSVLTGISNKGRNGVKHAGVRGRHRGDAPQTRGAPTRAQGG